MNRILCIDIGGTAIKSAVFNNKGEKLTETKIIEVKNTIESNKILIKVKEIIEHNDPMSLAGVAISSAGVIDSDEGIVIHSGYTILNYDGTNFKKELKELYDLPCTIENDVNCALLGEIWQRDLAVESAVCLTIGTGVGGAVMLENKLLKGIGNSAGEVGYMQINQQNFQDIASTSALITRIENNKDINKRMNGREIIQLAKEGHKAVLFEIDNWIDDLSIGLINIMYLLNPEQLILGGGIMEESDFFEKRIKEKIERKLIDPSFNKTQLTFASLGNEAGMVGALKNYLNLYDE